MHLFFKGDSTVITSKIVDTNGREREVIACVINLNISGSASISISSSSRSESVDDITLDLSLDNRFLFILNPYLPIFAFYYFSLHRRVFIVITRISYLLFF